MMYKLFFFISLIIFTLMLSCSADDAGERITKCEDGEEFTYADVQLIVETNCASPSCHSPSGTSELDYTNLDDLKSSIENGKFEDRTFILRDMPSGFALDTVDLNKLICWSETGYLF